MENERNIDSILMNINRSSAGIVGAITFSSRMTFKLVMFMLRLGHKGAVGLGLADDFKAFVKESKGEFTVYNIPLTQEKTDTVLKIQALQKQVDTATNPIKRAELRQEIKSLEKTIPELEQLKGLGIQYCTMPKLNGSSQTFQIAVSKKHDQVFKTWFLNHLTSELCGGEKNLEDIKVFTEGNYSIFNMPFEGNEEMEPMLSDFKTLGVNYSIMPDLKIGDGYTQIAIPNADRSRLEAWFKLWQDKQLANGEEVKAMYEINTESYMNTAEMSQDEYITSADKQYQDINKEFEEKAISVPYSDQLQKENSPEFVKYLQDNNYEKVSINKETLVENMAVSEKVNEMRKNGWFASRIPGTYGDNQKTLLVPVGRVFEADDGKTYVAFLKKNRSIVADNKGNASIVSTSDVMKPYEKVSRAFNKVKSMDATKTMDATKMLSEGANKTVEMASKLTQNMKL